MPCSRHLRPWVRLWRQVVPGGGALQGSRPARIWPTALVGLMVVFGPVGAIAGEGEPAVPPGIDNSEMVVAYLGAGIDYADPSLAQHLARDGEGTIIGLDFADRDLQPFAPAGTGSNAAVRALLGRVTGVSVAPYRIPAPDLTGDGAGPGTRADIRERTREFLQGAAAHVALSPARVLVVSDAIARAAGPAGMRMLAANLPDLVVICAAAAKDPSFRITGAQPAPPPTPDGDDAESAKSAEIAPVKTQPANLLRVTALLADGAPLDQEAAERADLGVPPLDGFGKGEEGGWSTDVWAPDLAVAAVASVALRERLDRPDASAGDVVETLLASAEDVPVPPSLENWLGLSPFAGPARRWIRANRFPVARPLP